MRILALLVAVLWTMSAGAQEYVPSALTSWTKVGDGIWIRTFVEGNFTAHAQVVAMGGAMEYTFRTPCFDFDKVGNVTTTGEFQTWKWIMDTGVGEAVGCDGYPFPVEDTAYFENLLGAPPYKESP